MPRIRLLEDTELDDDSRAAAQAMEAQGKDTSTLRGLAHSRELFKTYNQFYFLYLQIELINLYPTPFLLHSCGTTHRLFILIYKLFG